MLIKLELYKNNTAVFVILSLTVKKLLKKN